MRTRSWIVLALLLVGAALAGCGGGSSASFTPTRRGFYTVNGGGGFNVDGTASFINTAQANAVTARAFDVGKAPNWMVIRGNQGFIVNSVSNNVQIVDLSTGQTVGVVSTGDFSNPMKLAFGPDGRAYVTNLIANNVAVVDVVNRTLLSTVDVRTAGTGPTGIAVASGKLYVTLTNLTIEGQNVTYGPGKVAVIPVGSAAVATVIDVPTNPQDAVVDERGRVHVSCTGNYGDVPGRIAIIDPATDSVVSTINLGGTPGNLTAVPGGRVFVADAARGVMVYDGNTGAVIVGPNNAITAANASILDVRYDPQTRMVYAADFAQDRVLIIDPATATLTGSLAVGNGPTAIGVYPQ